MTLPLLQRVATLRDVANAFSSRNLDNPEYFSRATAEARGDVFRIRGKIYHRSAPRRIMEIGEFERRIAYMHGQVIATHVAIQIYSAVHRGKRTAFYHYRKAFRFYDRVGIRYVELDATDYGTTRWPQFGFDFVSDKKKQRLAKILRDAGVQAVATALTATEVAMPDGANDKAGLDALERLAADGPAKMAIDLGDPRVRIFLRKRGILALR